MRSRIFLAVGTACIFMAQWAMKMGNSLAHDWLSHPVKPPAARRDLAMRHWRPRPLGDGSSCDCTHKAASSVDPVLTGRAVVQPTYNASILNKWGFQPSGCAPGANFLVADTGMVSNWICPHERPVVDAMDGVFSAACHEPDNVMLDIGSNSGFYGMYALACGCRAIFVDPQPGCNAVVNGQLLVNSFADRGRVIGAGVAAAVGTQTVSSSGDCAVDSGRFPLIDEENGSVNHHDASVPLEPLDRFIVPGTKVLLMKIDTEGFEHAVLQGSMHLFRHGLVRAAIVEITPGFGLWQKRGVKSSDVVSTLASIMDYGYSAKLLHCTDKEDHPLNGKSMDALRLEQFIVNSECDQGDLMLERL